ncbi:hypothetical protein [Helicobacter sp. MIT 14-3879]|uniref:hypothetical protein n=1 Tax=Helicobacter sp. MIT 14-3879 TaxID=2040649 RepID=UPI000E1ED798|nr:hypothetical protein [Helicobacter sp. MIT 14-3879]RDU64850.1 hypothetical protein CQA44_03830 [Helicobacter sp. MIT 14-3879]
MRAIFLLLVFFSGYIYAYPFICFQDIGKSFYYSKKDKKTIYRYQHCLSQKDFQKVAICVHAITGKSNGKDGTMCERNFNSKTGVADPGGWVYEPDYNLINGKWTVNWQGCRDMYGPAGIINNVAIPAAGRVVHYKKETLLHQDSCLQGGKIPVKASPVTPPPKPTPPPTPTKLIIKDEFANEDITKIHTKISGNSAVFHIFKENSHNRLGSGLKSVTCTIDGSSSQTITKDEFTLNDAFVFKYKPQDGFPNTGTHSINCSGVDNSNNPVEGEATFYSAPDSYTYTASVSFPNGHNTEKINPNNVEKIKYNNTKQYIHNNSSWNRKPVIKTFENLELYLDNVYAYNARGVVDTGVKSTISIDINNINEFKNDIKKITTKAPNVVTINKNQCKSSNPNIPTINPISLVNGAMSASKTPSLTFNNNNALIGTMSITYQDKDIATKIESERKAGNCGKYNKAPCPIPAKATFIFDYQVVPNDFKVEVLDAKSNPLKVLYFGQGSNPSVEENSAKIKLTAIGTNAKPLDNFDASCAAQDVDIDINLNSKDAFIELLNKDGSKSNTIPLANFKQGIAEIEKIISIKKDANTNFTPNMKNEPVFLDKGISSEIAFTGFNSNNTYYPSYTPANNGIDMVILRGRINAIDTDDNTKAGSPSPTKVYYEFQCEYCDLNKLGKITGVKSYKQSPTQQGWFIDSTFSNFNSTKITKDKVAIESGGLNINSISNPKDGIQEISYGSANSGKYKLNISHGELLNGKIPISMPDFLLYNPYWNKNVKWHTSSFIYIKGRAKDDNRDYGVDTGVAKNTRNGGRTGGF